MNQRCIVVTLLSADPWPTAHLRIGTSDDRDWDGAPKGWDGLEYRLVFNPETFLLRSFEVVRMTEDAPALSRSRLQNVPLGALEQKVRQTLTQFRPEATGAPGGSMRRALAAFAADIALVQADLEHPNSLLRDVFRHEFGPEQFDSDLAKGSMAPSIVGAIGGAYPEPARQHFELRPEQFALLIAEYGDTNGILDAIKQALSIELFARWPDADTKPRANRDDVRLARVAATYVDTIGDADQVAKIAALGYSRTSVPRLISRARKRGLLTPTTRGRAGGQLTPKAHALLRHNEESQ